MQSIQRSGEGWILKPTKPMRDETVDAGRYESKLLSWNMAHLVNMRKVERINAVNERAGLPRIRIHTPEEVVDL